MQDAESILKAIKPPQRTATICVAGDLQSRYEMLKLRFDNATDKRTTMNAPSEKEQIAEEIKALYQEMQEHTVTFCFEAMPLQEWLSFQAEHKPRKDQDTRWNLDTFVPALIKRCMVTPQFTEEQIGTLLDNLSYAQVDELFGAAHAVNEKKADLPFIGNVLSFLERSEQKSK